MKTITFKPPKPPSYDIPKGRPGVATWINNRFQSGVPFKITVQHITAWINGEQLPVGCSEPFPKGARSGRYSSRLTKQWVDKYLFNASEVAIPQQVMLIDLDDDLKRIKISTAKIELEKAQREHDAAWLPSAEHVASLQRVCSVLWNDEVRLVETDLIAGLSEAVHRGLTGEELVQDAIKRHQAAIDARQRQYKAYASGAVIETNPGEIPCQDGANI